MLRKLPAVLVVIALAAVACSGETAETTTTSTISTTSTTTSTTTTTTIPATTTTLPPVSVENAPPELAAVIDAFYDFAAGRSADPPPMVAPALATITPQPVDTPATGSASVVTFRGQGVATVETGGDLFLLINEGTGWWIAGGAWPSLGVPAYFGGAPRIVAVIGSDARPGEDIRATRADSIHLVALDGAGGGGVVGIPRDSWIIGPGGGRTKITDILSNYGPEAFLETLRGLTGLPIEGWVLTGFGGFEQMVSNVLGGVTVEIPFAINDSAAKANLAAGVHLLDGAQALSFARARKTVSGGDFARSSHQGRILIAAAKRVQEMGYGAIPTLLAGSEPWIDHSLTPEQLLTFSAMAISANLDSIPNVVAPGSTGSAGRASVVFLSDSVSILWADLADGRLAE